VPLRLRESLLRRNEETDFRAPNSLRKVNIDWRILIGIVEAKDPLESYMRRYCAVGAAEKFLVVTRKRPSTVYAHVVTPHENVSIVAAQTPSMVSTRGSITMSLKLQSTPKGFTPRLVDLAPMARNDEPCRLN
jgi:hypothetical protein